MNAAAVGTLLKLNGVKDEKIIALLTALATKKIELLKVSTAVETPWGPSPSIEPQKGEEIGLLVHLKIDGHHVTINCTGPGVDFALAQLPGGKGSLRSSG